MVKWVASNRQPPAFYGVGENDTWFVCDKVALAISVEQHFDVVSAEVLHEWCKIVV